jgi:glycosyl-4,4'-diaponeurosporenoate acyltransferase
VWFLRQAGVFIIIAGGLGILSHVVGEALPRGWFDPESFPYATYKWEKNGSFYKKYFKIEKWKHKLPDKSRAVKTMERKSVGADRSSEHMLALAVETCVAEAVHFALLLCSPIFAAAIPSPLGAWVAVLYGLSHVPFIMIQRYNRPRLLRSVRHARREEAMQKDENFAAVQ